MSWRIGTATDYVDLLNKLRDHATANHVATAVIAAGGTGYTVGDVVTVAGGTALQACKFLVTTAPAGVVTAVQMLLGGGSYTANPATPNSPTGGTGTGLSLTLTFASNGWTVLRDNVYNTPDKELILQGSGSGSDAIFVGIRTYHDINTLAFNWELAGFTGYSGAATWNTQPGISPGRNDDPGTPQNVGGSYLPLDSSASAITYWMSATGRRLIVTAKVSTAYMTCYLGFYNSFNTTLEQPYPLVIAGMTSQKETRFNSTRLGLSFLAQPCGKQISSGATASSPGPVQVRWADGSWQSFQNRFESWQATNVDSFYNNSRLVYPMSYDHVNAQASEDNYVNTSTWDWNFIVPNSTGVATWELHPTPNTAGNLVPLWPVGMVMESPSYQILGEFDGVFWVSVAGSALVSEDSITINNQTYRLFQNCFRTDSYQYIAIAEL